MIEEPGTGVYQRIEPAARLQDLEPSERSNDVLSDLSIDAFGVNDLQVLIFSGLFDAHKHGGSFLPPRLSGYFP